MKKIVFAIVLVSCLPLRARAQVPACVFEGQRIPASVCAALSANPRPGSPDPLERFLFPPELVMAHQQAIGLTDRQRSAIQDAMKEAQMKFIDVQFKMSGEVEKLQRLLESATVDEAKVHEQVDRLLNIEREVKHAQLSLMIRVKNQLTEQQQAELGKLRTPRPGDMIRLPR